jgi:hypothetical protein
VIDAGWGEGRSLWEVFCKVGMEWNGRLLALAKNAQDMQIIEYKRILHTVYGKYYTFGVKKSSFPFKDS